MIANAINDYGGKLIMLKFGNQKERKLFSCKKALFHTRMHKSAFMEFEKFPGILLHF